MKCCRGLKLLKNVSLEIRTFADDKQCINITKEIMKKNIAFSLFLISLLLTHSLSAQNNSNKNMLPGSWLGKLSVNGIELRLVFNLKLNEKDSLIATMDSPDQGAKNIPMGRVILNGEKLSIQAPILKGNYTGTFKNDTIIEGIWTQLTANYPLNLGKLKTAFALIRPQEPKP
jgi:hypothetical protein